MRRILILPLVAASFAWAKNATYIRQPDNSIWRVEMYQESEERDARAQLLEEIKVIDKTISTLQESAGTDVTVTALLDRRLKLAQEIAYFNSPDVSSPTVGITSPLNNATISGQVDIIVDAYDDRDIPIVQFKIDGTDVGQLMVYPYAFRFNSTLMSNGPHVLSAIGQDSVGNIKSSAEVTVNVSN